MTLQGYFDSIVSKVLNQTGYTKEISITFLDHDTLDDKKAQTSYGICYKLENGTFSITIDKYFVTECYDYFILDSKFSSWALNDGRTLEKVICHELAHTMKGAWNHGKKHTNLTNELLSKVTLPEKYYQYLLKKAV